MFFISKVCLFLDVSAKSNCPSGGGTSATRSTTNSSKSKGAGDTTEEATISRYGTSRSAEQQLQLYGTINPARCIQIPSWKQQLQLSGSTDPPQYGTKCQLSIKLARKVPCSSLWSSSWSSSHQLRTLATDLAQAWISGTPVGIGERKMLSNWGRSCFGGSFKKFLGFGTGMPWKYSSGFGGSFKKFLGFGTGMHGKLSFNTRAGVDELSRLQVCSVLGVSCLNV